MLTNWRWGESVCCLVCAGISAELGMASSLSGVWSVPCSLCSGWTCGTPAIWSLGMSFWEVCVCPCGSWVRPEYTTHGEKKTGHTFHPPPSPHFRITCYNCPFLIQSSFKDVIKRHFFLCRYFLQPRENGGKSVKVDELGSLRLNIVYTEDHVFPSEHYTPLRDLLLHSANVEVCAPALLTPPPHSSTVNRAANCRFSTPLLCVQPVSASTAHTLGEVCREKQEAAIPLVRLFLHYGKIVPFISAIAHAEINRTQWVTHYNF